ncbi:endonuclease III [Veillonella montpellierensis]|uniref:endonuclease III n=1 Tax=Veillonella montpellierensis TaxID=187328 RepID=UPI0023F97F4E|nr:endonuclease III [Veillonella montpellierensis]
MRVTKAIKAEQLKILSEVYKDAKPALVYNSPFELLVAVILSAQCTDERVNIITRRLFPLYSDPADMLALGVKQLEVLIRDCGLYRAKAANLIGTCDILVHKYAGEVPTDFESLLELPGVGRKTANVVVSVLWGIPAIAVDTHVFRVANRLKLGIANTPLEMEGKLQKAIPKKDWAAAHHWLIWHGRKICKARKPLCHVCPLAKLCPSAGKVV